jgi:formate-dependent nitrite reductase membrane component NrfD
MSAAASPTDAVSYYGRPIVKEPVWKPFVPWYFFTGGLAGGSASLAFAARLAGNDRLARSARIVNLAAIAVSPVLLIADLGRPRRFLNMLRVFKPTSPMSVGTWVVSASGAASGIAAGCELLGVLPRARLANEAVAGALGPALATYTGVLIADTVVPAWSEAGRELPFVFAAGAAASAGGAAALLTPAESAGPARRLAIVGGAAGLASMRAVENRLGPFLGEPYRHGRAGALARAAKTAQAAGTALMAVAGRRRAGAAAAGCLLLAGAALERFAVFHAGRASAADPRFTSIPQRQRVDERAGAMDARR